jgi:hypothetical protein
MYLATPAASPPHFNGRRRYANLAARRITRLIADVVVKKVALKHQSGAT